MYYISICDDCFLLHIWKNTSHVGCTSVKAGRAVTCVWTHYARDITARSVGECDTLYSGALPLGFVGAKRQWSSYGKRTLSTVADGLSLDTTHQLCDSGQICAVLLCTETEHFCTSVSSPVKWEQCQKLNLISSEKYR